MQGILWLPMRQSGTPQRRKCFLLMIQFKEQENLDIVHLFRYIIVSNSHYEEMLQEIIKFVDVIII